MQNASSRGYGEHGGPYTRCARTEYAPQGKQRRPDLSSQPFQGYELAEEEVRITLDEFREKYSDASGAPEYVLLPSTVTDLTTKLAHS